MNLQNKRGSSDGVSAASPMIKSAKGVEKRMKGVSAVEVAYFSLGGGVSILYSNFPLILGNIIS